MINFIGFIRRWCKKVRDGMWQHYIRIPQQKFCSTTSRIAMLTVSCDMAGIRSAVRSIQTIGTVLCSLWQFRNTMQKANGMYYPLTDITATLHQIVSEVLFPLIVSFQSTSKFHKISRHSCTTPGKCTKPIKLKGNFHRLNVTLQRL